MVSKMPLIDLVDLRHDAPQALTDCDVCIIGSGPAGSTIARELRGGGRRVTVLESGGLERDPAVDALNEIESVGRPRWVDQWGIRNRMVGGSSHTWGGRCAPFDEIDFEARAWIPMSGWPLRQSELAPYLDRSAAYLGLAAGSRYSDDGFWALAGRRPPAVEFDPGKLRPCFWQFSKDGQAAYAYEYMRLGPRLLAELEPNITLVAHATVLEIVPVSSGAAVASVVYIDPHGRMRCLRAPTVVLCAGGIENPRILLSSTSVARNGLGNDRDLVGRYLMDHPRGPVGSFDVKASRVVQNRLGRKNVRGHLFRAGVRLSPDLQRAEQLLNCAAWLGEVADPGDPLEAVKRFARGRPELPGDLVAIASNAGLLARGAYAYAVEHNGLPRKLSALTLDAMCEQRPDPESRVLLSDRTDRHGMRLSRIDWRVHADEARAMRRLAQCVAEELPRLGLPAPRLADWVLDGGDLPETFIDVGHPTGATRMAVDPASGVVDANSQVHGVEGLFVAGTSVFPTAGHANPTQMIVAMSLRLADHLKARTLRATGAVTASPRRQAKPKVLVTGAAGGIGRVVVEDLLERGYAVRATTSRAAPGPERDLEWRSFDFFAPGDFDDLVAGCDAVVHLAADRGRAERMPRVNAEATERLAEAAERSGVGAFCYTSTVSVYGSGKARIMGEDAPVLCVDRDVRSEYWALPYVRTYGRTKLAGEHAISRIAARTPYVIFRPTSVVGIDDIIGIRDWNVLKRTLAAHRHAHHIYVWDVSDAIIWAIERGLNGAIAPGAVEIYNLAEDDYPEPRHADFLRKAYAASGDRRFRIATVPGFADWLHDFLRFRSLPPRRPLWWMRFPNERLRRAGYTPRFGLEHAYAIALERLRHEAAAAPPELAREDAAQTPSPSPRLTPAGALAEPSPR